MTFTIEADIGGFLIMEHRENHVNETHNLIGTTKTLQYVFRWDFVLPYHCVEKETTPENCVNPLTVPDLTEQASFVFDFLIYKKKNNQFTKLFHFFIFFFANVWESNVCIQDNSEVSANVIV